MATTYGSARQRIIDAAVDLFSREGIRAVGIEAIVEQAGVTKMTLYRHFASKDDLVVAYLEQRNVVFWSWYEASMRKHEGSPRDQLVELFTSLHELLPEGPSRGCPFLNTATEFPEPSHPGHQFATAQRQTVLTRLQELAEKAGAYDPKRLANLLLLIMDGAFSTTQLFGPAGPAADVQYAAITLIAAYCASKQDM